LDIKLTKKERGRRRLMMTQEGLEIDIVVDVQMDAENGEEKMALNRKKKKQGRYIQLRGDSLAPVRGSKMEEGWGKGDLER
jgi:hypothetical protein